MQRSWNFSGVVAILLCACPGRVSEGDLLAWSRTTEGLRKLAEVVADSSQSEELRVKAAEGMLLRGSEAAPVFQKAISKAPDAIKLMGRQLAQRLDKMLAHGKPTEQLTAKDFLATLIVAGDDESARRACTSLASWISSSFDRRFAAGSVDAHRALVRCGDRVLPILETLVRPGIDVWRVAKIIREIGDPTHTARASKRLDDVARQEAPKVEVRTIMALSTLGDATAAKVLAGIASDRKFLPSRRRKASEQLRRMRQPAAIPEMMNIAVDPEHDVDVRADALLYIGRVCEPNVCGRYVRRLRGIISLSKLRWYAVGAVMAAGGPVEVPRVFLALKPKWTYKKAGLEALAADIATKVGRGALPHLRRAVVSGPWHVRYAAVLALGRLGTAQDVAVLRRALARPASVPAEFRGPSFADQAKAAVDATRARRDR